MKTVVIGPEGRLYLTDGHHTFTTLSEQPEGGATLPMWVKVTDNFSDSPDLASFWRRMQAARKVWLNDGQGQAITPEQIPAQLGLATLDDDPYRALVYFTREVAYDKPRSGDVAPEFLEFYWGNWLREQLNLSDYDLRDKGDYRDAIGEAAIVGKQQQTAGIEIEATDRDPAPVLQPWQFSKYAGAAGRIIA